jgi:hypothetical protein
MHIITNIKWWFRLVGAFFESLFEDHALVRRVLVVWACWLISVLVLKFISLMTTIDTATVTGVATIVGILSTVLVFYVRARELELQARREKGK